MFHMTRRVPAVRALRTPTRPPSGETPLRLTVPAPYLSYVLCASHRVDLLTATLVRDGHTSAMPPFCWQVFSLIVRVPRPRDSRWVRLGSSAKVKGRGPPASGLRSDTDSGQPIAERRWMSNQLSCSTIVSRASLILRPPLSSMYPNLLNLFIRTFIRARVVPTISASISCETFGSTR